MLKYLVTVGVLIFLTVALIFVGQIRKPRERISPQQTNAGESDLEKTAKAIKGAEIVFYKEWAIDLSTKLSCIVAQRGKEKYLGDQRQNLIINNEKGEALYTDDAGGEFINIEIAWVMRRDNPQLIIHKHQGGKEKTLQILDYQDGDIQEVSGEYDGYEISCEIRPSFRKGANPSADPYDILLTDGTGLPSPNEKITTLFRYQNGSYRKIGSFKRSLLDNQLEGLLSK